MSGCHGRITGHGTEERKHKRDPAGQAPPDISVTMSDYNSFQRVVAIDLRRPPFCLLNLTQVPFGQLKPTTVEEEDLGNQLQLNQVNIVQTTTVRLLLLAVVMLKNSLSQASLVS